MIRYKVITGSDPEIMSEIVNEHLKAGWTLHGSVSICPGPSVNRQTIYAQGVTCQTAA